MSTWTNFPQFGSPLVGILRRMTDSAGDRLLARLHKPVHELPPSKLNRFQRFLRRHNNRLEKALFERGVETATLEAGIEHFHPDRVTYQPSGWRYLGRVLRRGDVTRDDVFLDMGCGKGRVLIQACRYPFKRVIGVEVDPALADVARENLARAGRRSRCGDVEIVVADAAEYAIPDDLTVMYLYYPFAGETFRRVMANVVESLDRTPRRLRIVYALPHLEEAVLATGRFRLAGRSAGVAGEEMRLYETV